MVQGLHTYGFEAMEERMSLRLVTLHGLIYIFGAFLYAVHHSPLRTRRPSFCRSALRLPFSRLKLTLPRSDGQREPSPASSTSGGARTSSSISASSSPQGPTCTPCHGPLITTTQSWAPSAPDRRLASGNPMVFGLTWPTPKSRRLNNRFIGIITRSIHTRTKANMYIPFQESLTVGIACQPRARAPLPGPSRGRSPTQRPRPPSTRTPDSDSTPLPLSS